MWGKALRGEGFTSEPGLVLSSALRGGPFYSGNVAPSPLGVTY
jgi:hypothetical protein